MTSRVLGGGGRGDRGFTLLEALVSLTLLAVLLTQVDQARHGVLALLEWRGQRGGEQRAIDRARLRFEADCRQFVVPGFRPPGSAPALELVQVRGASSAGRLSLVVVSRDVPGTQGLRRVTYLLGGDGLVRRDAPHHSAPHATSSEGAGERSVLLVPGARDVELALLDGRDWVTDWTGRSGVPRAVRLRFETLRGGVHEWAAPLGTRVRAAQHPSAEGR